MPSISGGALRHLRVTEWARWLVIGFHALDLGRGVATRSHPRGSRPMERFPCPRSRAGRCDVELARLEAGRGGRFHALDLGRGVATWELCKRHIQEYEWFPCPRSRAGRCDIGNGPFTVRAKVVSMPSISGGALRRQR